MHRFAAILAAAALASCAHAPPAPDEELARIVAEHGIAGAALAVMAGDRLVYAGASGCAEYDADGQNCARPLRAESKLRVASISKMALALGLMTLVEEGRVDLDTDVSNYLGWTLRNPAFPDQPITARQLLSHTSSVADPEEYWIAAPGNFRALFETPPFDPEHPPGAFFRYANLNYGILAGVIEGASGMRFDEFMTARLFKPNGLDIGYNWSGVSLPARNEGAALSQREDGRWVPVVDAPPVLADDLPWFLAADGLDRADYLESYKPGDNPTLFSPQGGLRASAMDLVKLVRLLKDAPILAAPVWRHDEENPDGETENGFYAAFGLGVQIVEGNDSLLEGETLIGHSGDAYGLHSGAWILKADPATGRAEDIAFAFVSTGFPDAAKKGKHPTFNAVEERLVRLALSLMSSRPSEASAGTP